MEANDPYERDVPFLHVVADIRLLDEESAKICFQQLNLHKDEMVSFTTVRDSSVTKSCTMDDIVDRLDRLTAGFKQMKKWKKPNVDDRTHEMPYPTSIDPRTLLNKAKTHIDTTLKQVVAHMHAHNINLLPKMYPFVNRGEGPQFWALLDVTSQLHIKGSINHKVELWIHERMVPYTNFKAFKELKYPVDVLVVRGQGEDFATTTFHTFYNIIIFFFVTCVYFIFIVFPSKFHSLLFVCRFFFFI